MLYDKHHVFINGEAVRVRGTHAATLAEWFAAGWLRWKANI